MPFVERSSSRSGLGGLVKYKGYDAPTLLHGEMVPSQDVSWDYIPTYFVMQLGEVFLLFAGLGFLALLVRWYGALRRRAPWPCCLSFPPRLRNVSRMPTRPQRRARVRAG